MRKLTNQEVKTILEERGYKMLSEYRGNRVMIEYVCRCGRVLRDTLGQIKKKSGCIKCCVQKNEYSYDYVRDFFNEAGCRLLSDSYSSSLSPLDFVCSCGKISRTGFFNFKSGRRCRACGTKKSAESRKRHYDKVGRKTKQENWEKRMQAFRKRKERDPGVRLGINLRNRAIRAIKSQGGRKSEKTEELLGCSVKNFRDYIESLFVENMSWDNYGRDGWTLDHIIPCKFFNLAVPEEQRKCFHYTNYQPMWFQDNILKSDFLPNGARARSGIRI